MKSFRNAFTLAEVLVTLGIIGVVAAMTLPTVIANVRYHELKTRLKKTYSELNQIAQKFYYDEGMSVPDYTYVGSGSSSNAFFRDFLPKQITGFAKMNDWTYADVDDENSNTTGSFNTTCAYYALRDVSPEDEGNSYWKDFLGIK